VGADRLEADAAEEVGRNETAGLGAGPLLADIDALLERAYASTA